MSSMQIMMVISILVCMFLLGCDGGGDGDSTDTDCDRKKVMLSV